MHFGSRSESPIHFGDFFLSTRRQKHTVPVQLEMEKTFPIKLMERT
jgi:hypothetical protein